jgi:hypothetical protein
MNLSDQVNQAIMQLKEKFNGAEPAPTPPPDATIESLWSMILELRGIKKKHRPSVEESVRLLLEDEGLAEIPIPMIAEIIREVFNIYGIKCKCSESSIRWYQSQRNLEWTIVRRKIPRAEVVNVSKTANAINGGR